MSMNLMEKGFALGSIGLSVLFMGAMYFKKPSVDKKDAFKVRQQLLKQQNVKMLYSTMSFFYLQGFKPESIQSFFQLQKILEIETPHMVALPISKQEYEQKYLKAMSHPKYREAMDKVIFHLKNRNKEELKNLKDFDLKNLEKLYLIDHCHRLKKCQLVFGYRTKKQYEKLAETQKKLEKEQDLKVQKTSDLRIEDYTSNIIQEMSPKLKFAVLPESPFKTIIGIIDPELLHDAAERWKMKFKQSYSHQVIEDEEVLAREQTNVEAKSGGHVY